VEMSRSIVALGHEVDLYISDAFLPQSRCIPGSGMRIQYLPTRLKQVFPPTIAPITPSLSGIVRDGATMPWFPPSSSRLPRSSPG